jgi:glycosyltransferase involved in cell wall biosynthesis
MIIAGPDEGDHWPQVEEAIRRANLGEVFTYIGAIRDSDKWDLYRQADLFILPTHSENFGVVVAEALASGLPVITTKGAPWGEIVKENCGWWVEIGVDPLAKALREATSLPANALDNMGERGRRMVVERFAWRRIAGDMLSVYRWMLDGGDAPPCVMEG